MGKYTQVLVLNLPKYGRIFFRNSQKLFLKIWDIDLLRLGGLYKPYYNLFRVGQELNLTCHTILNLLRWIQSVESRVVGDLHPFNEVEEYSLE